MNDTNPPRLTKISAGDEYLTRQFLQRARTENGYKCWGCGKEFSTAQEFLNHLQEKIDMFFRGETWQKQYLKHSNK